MMRVIKEQTRQYLLLFDLKSKIKDEERQEKALRSDLEKLQREVFELNDCLDTIKWKINRAEFILSCEKKRHDFFYSIIATAEDTISEDELFKNYKKYGFDLKEYKIQLEKKKTFLIEQLQELNK